MARSDLDIPLNTLSLNNFFSLSTDIVKRNWLRASLVFAIVFGLAFLYAIKLKPAYEVSAKLLFLIDRTPYLTGLFDPDVPEAGQLSSLLSSQTPLSNQVEIIQSRPLIEETIRLANLRDSEGEPMSVNALANKIDIKIVGGTDIVHINYTDSDPEVAASVVNTLLAVYQDYSSTANQLETQEALDFVSGQLPRAESNLRRAEQDLRQYKEENRIISLEDEARVGVESMEALNLQITSVSADLAEASQNLLALQRQVGLSPNEVIAVNAVSKSDSVQATLRELDAVDRELASQQSAFTETNPIIVRLQDKRGALSDLLEEQISAALGSSTGWNTDYARIGPLEQSLAEEMLRQVVKEEALVRRLDYLNQTWESNRARFDALPRMEENERQLVRQLEVAQTTYENLLSRLQELQVKQNEVTSNVRVIEPAIASVEPSSSSKHKVLVLGFLVATLIASLTVVIPESISYYESLRLKPTSSEGENTFYAEKKS